MSGFYLPSIADSDHTFEDKELILLSIYMSCKPRQEHSHAAVLVYIYALLSAKYRIYIHIYNRVYIHDVALAN